MIAALLLAAATPKTAIEAERAFAQMAQEKGQWTAFRAFAADDAVMFAPQPVNAQAFLKPLKDPPRAIEWSPAASFVSCDGKIAANTGPWKGADGSVGFFSTVWTAQPTGGWKWKVDGGDRLTVARPAVANPTRRRASCGGEVRRLGAPISADGRVDRGESPDHTLDWRWEVAPDGARTFQVSIWIGQAMEMVIDDRIPAPPAAE